MMLLGIILFLLKIILHPNVKHTRRQIENSITEQDITHKSAKQIECKKNIKGQEVTRECAYSVKSSIEIDRDNQKNHEFLLEQPFITPTEDQHDVGHNRKLMDGNLIELTLPSVHKAQSEI